MWRFLLRWLAPLVIAGATCLPAAHAQAPPPADPAEKNEPSPALPAAVAFLSAVVVLVIVCMPSRKG